MPGGAGCAVLDAHAERDQFMAQGIGPREVARCPCFAAGSNQGFDALHAGRIVRFHRALSPLAGGLLEQAEQVRTIAQRLQQLFLFREVGAFAQGRSRFVQAGKRERGVEVIGQRGLDVLGVGAVGSSRPIIVRQQAP